MVEILNLIKDLRDRTGAGFLDCKNALIKNDNNIEKSIDFLRTKGLSKANKKSARITKEGVVTINILKDSATMMEINTETDFSAKNNEFLDFVKKLNLNSNDTNNLQEFLEFKDSSFNVKESLIDIIAKIGENVVIKKFEKIYNKDSSKIFGYVHNCYEKNIGKIACLLNIHAKEFNEELNNLANNICMHIAAMKPLSLNIDQLDNDLIQKEEKILIETIKSDKNSNKKSSEVINKIVKGKLQKFFEDVVLLEQKFIIDNKTKIKEVLSNYSKQNNIDIKIIEYKLLILGN